MFALLELRDLRFVALAASIPRWNLGLRRIRCGQVVGTVTGIAGNTQFVMLALPPVTDDVGATFVWQSMHCVGTLWRSCS
jgi:hypothetical protein